MQKKMHWVEIYNVYIVKIKASWMFQAALRNAGVKN